MRAHWRPSLIAHTISDWPRRASPAANTPSAEVAYGARPWRCRARRVSTPSCLEQRLLGVQEAHRQQHEVGRISPSVPSTGANGGAASAWA